MATHDATTVRVPAASLLGVAGINPSTFGSPDLEDKHSKRCAVAMVLGAVLLFALMGYGTYRITQSEAMSTFTTKVQQYHSSRLNPVQDMDSQELRQRHYRAKADQIASQLIFDRPQLRLGATKRNQIVNPVVEDTADIEDEINDNESGSDFEEQNELNVETDNDGDGDDIDSNKMEDTKINKSAVHNRESFMAAHPHREVFDPRPRERKPNKKLNQMKKKGNELIDRYKKELLAQKLNPKNKEQSFGKGMSREMQQKLDPLMFLKRTAAEQKKQKN